MHIHSHPYSHSKTYFSVGFYTSKELLLWHEEGNCVQICSSSRLISTEAGYICYVRETVLLPNQCICETWDKTPFSTGYQPHSSTAAPEDSTEIWSGHTTSETELCKTSSTHTHEHPNLDTQKPKQMQETLPVALGITLQQFLHHVFHSYKPAWHSFVYQRSIRPAEGGDGEGSKTKKKTKNIFSATLFL